MTNSEICRVLQSLVVFTIGTDAVLDLHHQPRKQFIPNVDFAFKHSFLSC